MALIFPAHSTGPDLYQARKRGALGLVQGARLFPFRGGSLGPPPPLFPGVAFRGFGAPPLFFGLGFAPRDLAPGSSGS